jgi:delta 1-pyrroline-5-carboxylate dehydrogenase
VFEDRNPANTDDVVGAFQKSTAADVANAIDAARAASARKRAAPRS